MTVFGRVNHLGAEPGTQAYSALCAGWNEYLAKARVNGLAVFADAWLNGLVFGDRRRLTGSGSILESCSRRCAVQMTVFTLLYFVVIRQNVPHSVNN